MTRYFVSNKHLIKLQNFTGSISDARQVYKDWNLSEISNEEYLNYKNQKIFKK